MARLDMSHHYDASAERVWALATDYGSFQEVMAGVVTFDGLPTQGRCKTGDSFAVKVRLFGKMPPQDYRMTVDLCDDAAMTLQSREKGAGVQRWDHTLTVQPDGDGAILRDQIDIEAGWLTPLFRLWGRYVYGKRHQPRVRMLQAGYGNA